MSSLIGLFQDSLLDSCQETHLSTPSTPTANSNNSNNSNNNNNNNNNNSLVPPSPPISQSPTTENISNKTNGRYSRSEENLSSLSPPANHSRANSTVSTSSEPRWSITLSDDSELDDEKEEDAEDACKWLIFSGFPQYAQLYKENIPCDPSQVKFDHEFLTEAQLQAVTKRLLTLNAGLTRRSSKKPARRFNSLADDKVTEEDESRSRTNSRSEANLSLTVEDENGKRNSIGSDSTKTPDRKTPTRKFRGLSKDNLEATAVRGLGDSTDLIGDSPLPIESLDGEPQPVLSNKWTYRSDSKKYSRSFREARRNSDSPLESVAFAKVYANKWSNFVRQKSIKHESAPNPQEKSLFNLTCREILVVQSLSLVSLTNILDQRHGADSSANKKWQKKVMQDLTKLLQPKKNVEYNAVGIFGIPLQTILERTGEPLPAVIFDAMNYLSTSCLDMEGLFRKAGSAARTRELKEKCEKGGEIDFSTIPPHDTADLVKQYFRDLPEPLLSTQLSDIFMEAEKSSTPAAKTQMMQLIVPLLADENREVLQILLFLLSKIAKSSQGTATVKGNQMDAHNLAVVFAPNIFYLPPTKSKNTFSSKDNKDTALKEMQVQETACNCLKHMIENVDAIFKVDEDIFMQASFITTDRAPSPGLLHLFTPEQKSYFTGYMEKQVESLLSDVNDKFKSFFLYVRKDAVRIAYKRDESEMLQTWCGQAIVNSTPERALERIAYQRYLWDPQVQTERLIEEVDKETDIFYYVRRGRGPIPARDFCLMRTKRNLGNGKCLLVTFSIRHPNAPEINGIVRTQVYQNQFFIERNDATTSRITYISQLDLKGRTPNWYNKAAGVHDVMVLADIRKVLDQQQLPGPETCV